MGKPWDSATTAFKTGLSIIPGVGAYMGGQDANEANRDIANARNAMEVAESQKSRYFSSSEA